MIKAIQFIALLLAICLIAACNKDKNPISPYYWGNVNAQKNGIDWAANPKNWTLAISGWVDIRGSRLKKDTFALLIDKFNENNEKREHIGINNIPAKIGKYSIYLNGGINYDQDSVTMAAFTLKAEDGDVLVGYYNVLESVQNYISVEALDTVKNEVKGKFNITFINKYPKAGLPPDTIRFKNGSYFTRINKPL